MPRSQLRALLAVRDPVCTEHSEFSFLFSGLQERAADCNKHSTQQSQPEGVLGVRLKKRRQRSRRVCKVTIPKTPVVKPCGPSLSPPDLSQLLQSQLCDCPHCSSSESLPYLVLLSWNSTQAGATRLKWS